jgi:hypothetical protein
LFDGNAVYSRCSFVPGDAFHGFNNHINGHI